MPKIRIKQLHERVATDGLHMGEAPDGMYRRKLEPGEIVDIPEDVMIESNRLDEPVRLIDMLWNTGLVDMVPDTIPVTRPLDYLNVREGRVCSPSFKAISPTDAADREQALARVAKRLAQAEQPSDDDDDDTEEEAPPQHIVTRSRSRRGRRAAHGEANTS